MARKTLVDLDVVGDITVSGDVDGRDVSVDGTTQDSHIADGTIHNKTYTQTTEPSSWNVGDIWIETTS